MLTLHTKVVDATGSEGRPIHGDKQAAYVAWKEFPQGACLVLPDRYTRQEFGPGIFRVAKGEMLCEHAVRINPAKFTMAFVDNELYVNESIIQFNELKLTKLIINNLELFTQAFR